jgi:5'-3' exonuclease
MRLHLVDGTFELYRAHFAPRPPHLAPDGKDVKATLGLTFSMLALAADQKEAVTRLAVFFDNPIRSFRNDLFDGYKSDEGVPPELRGQFDLAEESVRAAGIVVFSMRDFEADDGIATLAARFKTSVEQVRIMSPDKDFGQLLDGAHVVQVDRMRNRVLDEAALLERRGIRPESLPDWLALVGDDADGIPGVPGIGETTASALLGAYTHLEAIPADPADWSVRPRGAPAIAASLAAHREAAMLYRRLATLRTDAPLTVELDDLAVTPPGEALARMAERLGSSSLRKRAG